LFIIADVEDVKYVINFDYPNTSEDYIHRIGRTGRCNLSGTAYAFFTPNNARQAKELIAVLEEANQAINPKLAELANIARSTFRGKGSYTFSSLFTVQWYLWFNFQYVQLIFLSCDFRLFCHLAEVSCLIERFSALNL
jgi:hypothetical protein